MEVELFLVALAEALSSAFLFVCRVDHYWRTVDQHLHCLVGSNLVLVEAFFSFPQFASHSFVELLHDYFLLFLIFDILPNIDIPLSILSGLNGELASVLPTRISAEFELAGIRDKDILFVYIINFLSQWLPICTLPFAPSWDRTRITPKIVPLVYLLPWNWGFRLGSPRKDPWGGARICRITMMETWRLCWNR